MASCSSCLDLTEEAFFVEQMLNIGQVGMQTRHSDVKIQGGWNRHRWLLHSLSPAGCVNVELSRQCENHRAFWCQGLHPDMAPAIPIIIYLMLGYWVKTCENLEPPIQSFPGCYRHGPPDEVTSLQNFSPVSLSWRWIPPSSASCAARQGLFLV